MFFQIVIGLLGTLALYLTIKGLVKAGSIIGLVAQPFWILMSIDKELWGVLVVSIAYLGVWCYGLLRKEEDDVLARVLL
jgi:hypothetical protein